MKQDKLYIEKELSWLAFNDRVLQEAADKRNPIIERMRFLGIYANNLDEFYKVRFSDLKRRVVIAESQGTGKALRHLLKKIQAKSLKSDEQFNQIYSSLLIELARHHIFLVNEQQLNELQVKWVKDYFNQEIKQYIIPILINSDTRLIDFLKDEYTYLAVEIIQEADTKYALLEIPTDKVPRFIKLPPEPLSRRKTMILADNVLRLCLYDIFQPFFDFESIHAYSMKMTRDAEYDLVTEVESSLLELMSSSLKQRLTAEPVRFTYQREMPGTMVQLLMDKLALSNYDSVVPGGRYHNFRDFINFPQMNKPLLQNKPLPALQHQNFSNYRNKFNAIKDRDILLYYPYYTFDHVLKLLHQAAFDPDVIAIKINIYRVAKDSQILNTIIHAAYNGKKVTVVVELQARFDEAANISWAKKLTQAGIHVIFSVPGLKIHAKLFLITRREEDKLVRYAHIGTGNFNEKTAKVYTDYALLTADPEITNEVRSVFNFIQNPFKPVVFNHLLVSPQNSRKRLHELMDTEIHNAQNGIAAKITLKINNLVDKDLTDKLYQASKAGVKIDLLVRGMCAIIPGIVGVSDNIRAISIVDRFLEHDRVYIFENGGNKKIYLSSADWMTRNIDYRIEVAVPIRDERIKNRVLMIINLLFSDNTKARLLNKALDNQYVHEYLKEITPQKMRKIKSEPSETMSIRGQVAVYHFLANEEHGTTNS